MARIKKFHRILFSCGVVLIFMYYLLNSNYGSSIQKIVVFDESYAAEHLLLDNPSRNRVQEGYLVWSPNCKIKDADPWDKSILPFIKKIEPISCSNVSALTYIERREKVGNVLKINETISKNYKQNETDVINCYYSVITRIHQNLSHFNRKADSKYSLSNCTPFQKEAELPKNTEFIFVNCTATGKNRNEEKNIYKNVHAMTPILPKVAEKMASKKSEKAKKLSVMILGIDSVSRLNVRRTMTKTLEYLQQNEWVELNGYNKVGDNTYPNLMALLTGEDYTEVIINYSGNYSVPMDKFPLIWNEYNEKGYITAYAEDIPNWQTFNLLQTGFVKQPTDYYMRPFMLAAYDLLPHQDYANLAVCLGPELILEHILNYAKSFSQTLKDYNYFGLFWLNSLSHSYMNIPENLDSHLSSLLKDLSDIGTYENTLMILISDHGMRFGQARYTAIGYYEERLPFIFIRLPKWFREKYPEKYKNLLINKNRLTNPYDVYVTLKRLLDGDYDDEVSMPISKSCPKCVGLFEEIPWDRGCEDAGIPPYWCMCRNFTDLNVKDPGVVQAGEFLFHYIVNITQEIIKKENIDGKLCANRTFSKIAKASGAIGSENNQYVVTIELNPEPATFQAMIETNQTGNKEPLMRVSESVSRLDKYEKVASCVNSRYLKYYCHCVK